MRTDGVMLGLPGATILFVYKTIRIICGIHILALLYYHIQTRTIINYKYHILAQNLDQSTCV